MVFWLFQLPHLLMIKSAIFCHVNNFDSTKLSIFGLIQIWECALNRCTIEPVHKPILDTCHLYILGATYPKHVLFCESLCANDSIWKFAWHSNSTYLRHLPFEFLIGHVLVGVNPNDRCVVVAPLPQIAKLPKESQNNGLKICKPVWVGILPSFEWGWHFGIWSWFEWNNQP